MNEQDYQDASWHQAEQEEQQQLTHEERRARMVAGRDDLKKVMKNDKQNNTGNREILSTI